MKFDIITIGDFRFPGGTSTAIAAETAILAKAGYRVGLISTAGPVLKFPHPIHSEIRQVLDDGHATLIAADQPVECALCLLHHPQVFGQWPHKNWQVKAAQTLLVVHHPLRDSTGKRFYDWQQIDTTVSDMFGPVNWAPVGPKVRQQFAGMDAPNLHPQDWTNVIEPEKWQVPRAGFMSAQPVIGRHSRPDILKWPDTKKAFLQVYPDDPHFDVKLMGYGDKLAELVGKTPDNWQILPFNGMKPREFLASIDFFVYYHHPHWVEAYGRSILEAMASGAVPVLHPHFRPLFGEGAIYAVPEMAQQAIRNLHKSPKLFLAQSARGIAVAKDIAGPQVLISRVQKLIGAPVRKREHVSKPVQKPKVMFFTSNGVGMGHLTRSLAVARRLPNIVEPVFLTLSKAFGLVEEAGIHAEYLPFHKVTKTNNDEWNNHLSHEIHAAISFHQPDVFVFDGNVPYSGLLAALDKFPAIWRVWMRRGMWAPGAGANHIGREKKFHAVIEPGEIAGKWDRGLTISHRDKTYGVGPIRLLEPDEILGRAAARREIGLSKNGTAVLVQLGSGNNFDMGKMRDFVLEKLLATPDVSVVWADWLIGDQTVDLPDQVIRLQQFPLSKLFKAFDFSIGAVGYNSYHEVLHTGLPTLFVPNQNPQQDEQHLRAKYAALKGMARMAYSDDLNAANAGLNDLLDTEIRKEMTHQCILHQQNNGAVEAARYLAEMALTRRQIQR